MNGVVGVLVGGLVGLVIGCSLVILFRWIRETL